MQNDPASQRVQPGQVGKHIAEFVEEDRMKLLGHDHDEISQGMQSDLREKFRDAYQATLDAYQPVTEEELAALNEAIEVAFWTSLEREEREWVRGEILLYRRGSRRRATHHIWPQVEFTDAIEFHSDNLRKLAPACREGDVMVVEYGDDEPMMIRGFAAPDSMTLFEPRREWSVAFARPGHVDVRSGEGVKVVYAAGRVKRGRKNPLATDSLYELSVSQLWWLREVVHALRSRNTGGIIIVVDDFDFETESDASVKVKEQAEISTLLRLVERDREERSLGVLANNPEAPLSFEKEAIAVLRGALKEHAVRVAALASIDGATVLDAGMNPLAFGVKLKKEANWKCPDLHNVDRYDPGGAHETSLRPAGGTRHLAAAYRAVECQDLVVIVVSEDGPAACIRAEEDGRLLYWPIGTETESQRRSLYLGPLK